MTFRPFGRLAWPPWRSWASADYQHARSLAVKFSQDVKLIVGHHAWCVGTDGSCGWVAGEGKPQGYERLWPCVRYFDLARIAVTIDSGAAASAASSVLGDPA